MFLGRRKRAGVKLALLAGVVAAALGMAACSVTAPAATPAVTATAAAPSTPEATATTPAATATATAVAPTETPARTATPADAPRAQATAVAPAPSVAEPTEAPAPPPPPPPPPPAAPAAVSIVEPPFRPQETWNYTPAAISVGAGSRITWTNTGSQVHTVTADNGAFDSDVIMPKGTFGMSFNTPGTFTYHCTFHPWMTGTVRVQG